MHSIIFIIQSFILGVVEGITEFLPISSTGHLIVFENLMKFKGTNKNYVEMYTYVIQLGAILAVVVLYWKKILQTLKNFFPQKVGYKKSGFRFWFMVVLACIPGFIGQMLLGDLADKYLFNHVSVAIVLFLGGILMIYAEKAFRNRKASIDKEIYVTSKQAWTVGLFQCLAIIPGMSRSASTIIGGWVAGLSTVTAAEFSFFLAIPVMLGMSFLKLVKIGGTANLTSLEVTSLGVGFFVAFVVALAVVKKFITYLKKKPMRIFAFYRMAFALVVLISGFFGIFG